MWLCKLLKLRSSFHRQLTNVEWKVKLKITLSKLVPPRKCIPVRSGRPNPGKEHIVAEGSAKKRRKSLWQIPHSGVWSLTSGKRNRVIMI